MTTLYRTTRPTGSIRLLAKRRAWFADEDNERSPGTDGENKPDPKHEPEKGLTQAEVDKIVGKTRTDTRKAAQQETIADILKRLGVEKLEDAESILKAHHDKQEADKSEVEKLTGKLAEVETRAKTAEQALTDYQAKVETEKRIAARDSAIKAALSGVTTKADKVLALLQVQHADAITDVMSDDGKLDEKKITALVETARKAYPEDFGARGVGSPSTIGGRNPTGKDRPKVKTSGHI